MERGNSRIAVAMGQIILRVAAVLMVFYIHDLHKLEGWIAYLLQPRGDS